MLSSYRCSPMQGLRRHVDAETLINTDARCDINLHDEDYRTDVHDWY